MVDDWRRIRTLRSGGESRPSDLNWSVPYSQTTDSWTTIINPHEGVFDWKLDELWRYRNLISLVWRDFVVVYKQTILGPAWHIITIANNSNFHHHLW